MTMQVNLGQVVDQALDQTIPMLPAAVLDRYRARFRADTGDDVEKAASPSDAQLTALFFKAFHNQPPYVDFAVWGPYAVRGERRHKFLQWVTDANGGERAIEMAGPRDIEIWMDCWRVFTVAAVMLGIARIGVLEKYAREFRDRARAYPEQWHVCVRADLRCRTEFWADERRRQAQWHILHPNLSEIDPTMPFDAVIKASATDKTFWDTELRDPCIAEKLKQSSRRSEQARPEQAAAQLQLKDREATRFKGGKPVCGHCGADNHVEENCWQKYGRPKKDPRRANPRKEGGKTGSGNKGGGKGKRQEKGKNQRNRNETSQSSGWNYWR